MDKEHVKKLAGNPKFMGRRGTAGFLTGETHALLRSFHRKGLELAHQRIKNDWECLILKISNLSSEGLL